MPFGLSFNFKNLIGKTKERSQMCEIFTEDGRIIDVEIKVLKGCAADDNLCSAWLLDADNQMQDELTGLWFQLLGERSTIPIAVREVKKVKDLKELINSIFHESWVIDLITIARDEARERQRTWIYLMLGVPICLAALVLGISVIK